MQAKLGSAARSLTDNVSRIEFSSTNLRSAQLCSALGVAPLGSLVFSRLASLLHEVLHSLFALRARCIFSTRAPGVCLGVGALVRIGDARRCQYGRVCATDARSRNSTGGCWRQLFGSILVARLSPLALRCIAIAAHRRCNAQAAAPACAQAARSWNAHFLARKWQRFCGRRAVKEFAST